LKFVSQVLADTVPVGICCPPLLVRSARANICADLKCSAQGVRPGPGARRFGCSPLIRRTQHAEFTLVEPASPV